MLFFQVFVLGERRKTRSVRKDRDTVVFYAVRVHLAPVPFSRLAKQSVVLAVFSTVFSFYRQIY